MIGRNRRDETEEDMQEKNSMDVEDDELEADDDDEARSEDSPVVEVHRKPNIVLPEKSKSKKRKSISSAMSKLRSFRLLSSFSSFFPFLLLPSLLLPCVCIFFNSYLITPLYFRVCELG